MINSKMYTGYFNNEIHQLNQQLTTDYLFDCKLIVKVPQFINYPFFKFHESQEKQHGS